MKVHVAVAGDEAWHHASRDRFLALAAADEHRVHAPTESPEEADVILFVDLHQHRNDPSLRALRHHPLVRRWRDKVCVYDVRDRPFATFPGVYVSMPSRRKRPWIEGGPYVDVRTKLDPLPLEAATLLYSFRGSRTHPVRSTILDLDSPRGIVGDISDINLFDWSVDHDSTLVREQQTYAEQMAAAKFVLCPRGHGPSTFRVFEALAAARVPVILSDDWIAPPRVPWEDIGIRIREADAARIPSILEAREGDWERLVRDGRLAVQRGLGDPALWHHLMTSIDDVHAARGKAQRWLAYRDRWVIQARHRLAALRR